MFINSSPISDNSMDDSKRQRIEKHLEAVSIKVDDLNIVEGLVELLDDKDNDNKDIELFFMKNGIPPLPEMTCDYFGAAYIVQQITKYHSKNYGSFMSKAPKSVLRYDLECELRAHFTDNVEHTMHHIKVYGLRKIKTWAMLHKVVTNDEFYKIVDKIKTELGLVEQEKPLVNNKKIGRLEREAEEPENPAIEITKSVDVEVAAPAVGNEIEAQSYEPILENVPFCEPMQPKKFVPPAPGKKRRQQLAIVYDEKKVIRKIKTQITAEKPIEEIVGYIKCEMSSSEGDARSFLKKIVYNSIADALWEDESPARNMIDYMDKDTQKSLAKDYLKLTAIPEKNGLHGITKAKKKLQKHLSLDETTLDGIISDELDAYFEKKKAEPKTKTVELKPDIDFNKQIYFTLHVKERAVERVGEDADQEWALRDMFHSGKTVYVAGDNCPHRIFKFSGEIFEIPYYETPEEYVLVTLFDFKGFGLNDNGYCKGHKKNT
jgi:hypothetical protein